MVSYVILGLLLGLPLLLGFVFRVSAPNIFFSVMAGDLLSRYVYKEAENAVESSLHSPTILTYTELLLIVLPMLFTALILHGSISRSKSLLNLVPLAITGVIFAVFALPLLPLDVQSQITSLPLGSLLLNLSGHIIGAVVALQLVAFWLINAGGHNKKKHKK